MPQRMTQPKVSAISSKRQRGLEAPGGLPPLGDNKKAHKKKTKKAAPVNETRAVVAARRPKLIWRTRDQENSMLYNLQLDVANLQSELQGLQAYRNLLMSRALNRQDDPDGSFMKTVQEYFRVFRHGYTHAQHQRALLALPNIDGTPTPDEFVRRVMDEHVRIGSFVGLEQMMKQWQRYTSLLGPMTVSFLDSEMITSFRGAGEGQNQVLVTSRAKYHLYISLRTIENMFPHLLPHQDIVDKILGRRISGVGKFDFVFNAADNRIVRYEFNLDLMASFIELLGDPRMVAILLKDALISDEFFIGDLSEFVPDQEPPPVFVAAGDEPNGDSPTVDDPKTTRPWKMTLSSILSAVGGSVEDVPMDEPRDDVAPVESLHLEHL